MDGMKLHEQAQAMEDTRTGYSLARELLGLREKVKELEAERDQLRNTLAAIRHAVDCNYPEAASLCGDDAIEVLSNLCRFVKTGVSQEHRARIRAEAKAEALDELIVGSEGRHVDANAMWLRDVYRKQAQEGE